MSSLKTGGSEPFDGEAVTRRLEEIDRRLTDPGQTLSDAERAELEKEALLLAISGNDAYSRRRRILRDHRWWSPGTE